MTGTSEGQGLDGVRSSTQADPLNTRLALDTRMLAAAQNLFVLSVELDAQATRIDERPEGYADAFRLIVLARDLGSVAHRLKMAAREMGQ